MVLAADSVSLAPEIIDELEDPVSGLSGVIVSHSTALGPAAGGCRFWHYDDRTQALADAKLLAEGMTYKNAIAGLPMGGGKAVIRVPKGSYNRSALFAAFGRAVQALNGRYVTAEDVGTTVEDMQCVATETRHVAGLPARHGRVGGDPSPWTAIGVISAMRLLALKYLDRPLSECTVAVQGVGHVGSNLVRMLDEAGARLIVADPKPGAASQVVGHLRSAEIMSQSAILDAQADIFAPCALGGVLNETAVSRLKAKVICGAANNQLACEPIADMLADHGILYAPDYIVNAGGIINVAAEYFGWQPADTKIRVEATGSRLADVLVEADRSGITPQNAAKAAACRIIAEAHAAKEKVDG